MQLHMIDQTSNIHILQNPDAAAGEKFKEISHAYEILSDSQKKQIYDQFGEAGLTGEGGGHGGMSAEDLFSQLFGGMGGGRGGQRGPRIGKDMTHSLKGTIVILLLSRGG